VKRYRGSTRLDVGQQVDVATRSAVGREPPRSVGLDQDLVDLRGRSEVGDRRVAPARRLASRREATERDQSELGRLVEGHHLVGP
jgi:hypothetical protein